MPNSGFFCLVDNKSANRCWQEPISLLEAGNRAGSGLGCGPMVWYGSGLVKACRRSSEAICCGSGGNVGSRGIVRSDLLCFWTCILGVGYPMALFLKYLNTLRLENVAIPGGYRVYST